MAKARMAPLALLVLLAACGGDGNPRFPTLGGSSGSTVPSGGVGGSYQPVTGPNVVDIVVDPGPLGLDRPYTNGLFATATICEPGTSNCQTIDHLLVDTGSVGVRVLESLITLALPDVQSASGQTLAGCAPFVDGTAWGPLKRADVQLGGEQAAGLTIHLIGEARYLMPSDCTGTAITDFQTLAANGILGVGIYREDCGLACTLPAQPLSENPRVYYACAGTTSGCNVTSVPLAEQVPNPVAAFPVDNNGLIIRLPGIASAGAPSVAGQLVFGLGTQDNNGLGSAAVVSLDVHGFSETAFPVGGPGYASIIDSGSNGLFFLDPGTTKLPLCSAAGLKDFYCPTSTTSLSATLAGPVGDAAVAFSVANASRLAASAFAFDNLAGPMPRFPLDPSLPGFDWGLPFFFGRAVCTAIEAQPTPVGMGPYLAF